MTFTGVITVNLVGVTTNTLESLVVPDGGRVAGDTISLSVCLGILWTVTLLIDGDVRSRTF